MRSVIMIENNNNNIITKCNNNNNNNSSSTGGTVIEDKNVTSNNDDENHLANEYVQSFELDHLQIDLNHVSVKQEDFYSTPQQQQWLDERKLHMFSSEPTTYTNNNNNNNNDAGTPPDSPHNSNSGILMTIDYQYQPQPPQTVPPLTLSQEIPWIPPPAISHDNFNVNHSNNSNHIGHFRAEQPLDLRPGHFSHQLEWQRNRQQFLSQQQPHQQLFNSKLP